jgi:hypothetical protein
MRRLAKLSPLIFTFLAFSAWPTFGQTVLPKSFADWSASSLTAFDPGAVPKGSANTDAAQLAAAAVREYGSAGGERATYARGADSLAVTLYRMKDVSGAYGEYTYLRTPDMQRADFTEHSFLKTGEALILAGNLVLDITGSDASKNPAAVNALLAAIAPHAQGGPGPGLPEHLPTTNRVNQTDHYILGPQTLDQFFPGQLGYSLGFAYGTEVETAQFHSKGSHDLTLLIADFPTPQIAHAQLLAMQKKFNISSADVPNSMLLIPPPGSAPSPTAGSPQLFAIRTQTLIAIVAGATSAEEANKLLDQVKSGTVLTWNEPTFQFKEPPIEVMVVGAIVGSGIICMFAAVAGLAFGGIRLGAKRLFPGKIFDRNNQVDFIQLAISSKAIKAEDFYGFDGFVVKGSKRDRSVPERLEMRIFK